MISTLIVEDDFRVARLHAEIVEALEGFTVVATVHTASAALDAARHHQPQLVLLDLYLPDASGLEVLRRLRTLPEPPDVVVLSAAREMQSVRAAMQGGALHYLIKPFDFDDLRQRLAAYAELHAARSAERETHQQEVDRLFGLIRRPSGAAAIALPKGHSPATAELVLEALRESGEPLSASDVSERVGISRATAQRYLTSLADAGKARLNLRYGTAGRPEHRYEPE
ncbi:MAG: response regulator [Actinobacteria bacterium]|nr:MAG: response regulator [Actinomycetota bacterium]